MKINLIQAIFLNWLRSVLRAIRESPLLSLSYSERKLIAITALSFILKFILGFFEIYNQYYILFFILGFTKQEVCDIIWLPNKNQITIFVGELSVFLEGFLSVPILR